MSWQRERQRTKLEVIMKSLIVNENYEIEEIEIMLPAYTEKQALVKTICCGICNGTDAKLIHGSFKGFSKEKYPLMLGHEGVGEVIEVGEKVKGLKKGDKVLLPFVDEDETRYKGLNSGWGAYSEYAVVNDLEAYTEGTAPECAYAQSVLPEWIDPVDACMIVTLREVLSSIHRFEIKKGCSVVVFGCGPVGLTFISFLKLLYAEMVIAVDIADSKLTEARSKGADIIINSREESVVDIVKKAYPSGVDFVLDAVGMKDIINQGMELIKDAGKICCYGIAAKSSAEIDWTKAPYNWQLQFQQFPSKVEEGACTEQILDWIKEKKIVLKEYISDYFPFTEYRKAFEKLEKREIAKKGIIVY